jgi:hypothetical protein
MIAIASGRIWQCDLYKTKALIEKFIDGFCHCYTSHLLMVISCYTLDFFLVFPPHNEYHFRNLIFFSLLLFLLRLTITIEAGPFLRPLCHYRSLYSSIYSGFHIKRNVSYKLFYTNKNILN